MRGADVGAMVVIAGVDAGVERGEWDGYRLHVLAPRSPGRLLRAVSET